ncbi:MAG: hypothetical protein J1F32_06520 [Erysipelotrichales bacterium]|nr:hypothetical protein [Erysipelotrichales bacterium]
MKNESLDITTKSKKWKFICIFILITNILCTLFVAYYFGYSKPNTISFNKSISSYNSDVMNTLLYINAYIVVISSIIQTISLFCFIIMFFKNNNDNLKYKIAKKFFFIATIFTIATFISYTLIEYMNYNISHYIITILELLLVVGIYIMTFAFINELNSHFLMKNEMRDYL